jgi:hypothetical protein
MASSNPSQAPGIRSPGRTERRQGRILADLAADGEWIGGEVEHAPDPGDDGG